MFIVAIPVDDLIVARKSSTCVHKFLKKLSENFNIKDMGKLHNFLGVKVVYLESGKIWIGQPIYTAEVLKKFRMENSKLTTTPCDAGVKQTEATSDSELFDKKVYQSAIGSLLYLPTRTKSDIAYTVGIIARFCSQPTKENWIAVKHTLRYLNGTRNYGLFYRETNNYREWINK